MASLATLVPTSLMCTITLTLRVYTKDADSGKEENTYVHIVNVCMSMRGWAPEPTPSRDLQITGSSPPLGP